MEHISSINVVIQLLKSNQDFQHLTIFMPWLGTPCGGINPYTLTAKLGPVRISGSGPPKDDVRPGQPVWSPAQGVKADLAIK